MSLAEEDGYDGGGHMQWVEHRSTTMQTIEGESFGGGGEGTCPPGSAIYGCHYKVASIIII